MQAKSHNEINMGAMLQEILKETEEAVSKQTFKLDINKKDQEIVLDDNDNYIETATMLYDEDKVRISRKFKKPVEAVTIDLKIDTEVNDAT